MNDQLKHQWTDEELHTLLMGLIQDKQYILKDRLKADYSLKLEGTRRYFVPTANIYISEDGRYIHWKHGGEGANKTSLDSLRFIVETILKCAPDDLVELSYSTLCDLINDDL